jgi:hypothetical protein
MRPSLFLAWRPFAFQPLVAGSRFATCDRGRIVWPKLSRVAILLVGPAVPNGGAAPNWVTYRP